jgi:hypothetical protein
VKEILQKADYQNIPKFGSIVSTQLDLFKEAVNLDKPIYYAAEGPLESNFTPACLYLFAEVKNKDSVITKIKSLGFEMIVEKDYKYYQGNEFSISVKNSLLIGVLKPKQKEFKGVLEEIYKQSENPKKEDKIAQLVKSKSDIVTNLSLESFYSTSNTDLEKKSESVKQLISSMVKDSYISNTLNFKPGELEFQTFNYFSDKLKSVIPLKENSTTDILKNMGKGEPRLGVLIQSDFKKFNNFIQEIDVFKDIANFISFLVQDDNDLQNFFGNILNGKLGVLVYDDPENRDSFVPVGNLYVGLGSNGQGIIEKLNIPFLPLIQKNISEDHILLYTNDEFSPSGELFKVPDGCENFGAKPVSAFVNLDEFPTGNLDSEIGERLIEKLDFAYLEYGIDGGKLKIKSKDSKTNILKQVVDQFLGQLSEDLLKLAF